jgi:hypothetical protein
MTKAPRRARVWAGIRRVLPWSSLVLGIASALWMDRRPERAWVVALAAGAGWILLGALSILGGVDVARLPERAQLVAKAAHLSARAAVQSLMQLCLFFALPFFVEAAAVPAHAPFVALLVLAAGATLWDPLYFAALRQPISGAALQALASFAGLDCVLPVLGLSNRWSLLTAGMVTAAGLPFAAWLIAPEPERRGRRTLVAIAVSVALVGALLLGAGRFVPPAPLKFVDGAIGTRVVERRLLDPATSLAAVPDQLVCFVAIAAPRGLHDRLRHRWRKDGVAAGEISLDVHGGRALGFRTWSFKHALTPGRWTCTTETESGQVLGRSQIRLGN